jgi:hypothetical protein
LDLWFLKTNTQDHCTYGFLKQTPPRSLDLWFLKTNTQDHWTYGFLAQTPQDHWTYGFLTQIPKIIGLMVSSSKSLRPLELWFLKTNPQDHWTDGFLTLLRTTSCLTERKNNNKIIKKRSKHRKSPNFV